MALLPKVLRAKAVYWEPRRTNEYGEDSYLNPVEIDCRWDESRTSGFDANGTAVVFNSQVMVDRDIAPGGLLRKGSISELNGANPPDDALRVLKFEKFENFKHTETFRVCML